VRNSLALVLLFAAVSAGPLWAQVQPSEFEAYAGYYYTRFNVNANAPGIAPSATYTVTVAVGSSSITSTAGSVR